MGWLDALKGTFDRRPPRLDLAKFRNAKPVRNPLVEWEEAADGTCLLVAPTETLPAKKPIRWLRQKAAPAEKKFELEPVGAYVWSLCDGQKTVANIVKALQDRYKMNRVEAEASLGAFLHMLSQRGLISLMVKKK